MKSNNYIKAVISDLGKVLLDFDHGVAVRNLAKVAGVKDNQVYDALFASGLEDRYENGLISTAELHHEMERRLGAKFRLEDLREATCNIFSPIDPVISMMAEVKRSGTPILLLSNTNELHFEYVLEQFPFVKMFEHHILSYVVKSMKPDLPIYQEAVRLAGVRPDECFFFDDIQHNVEGALKAGLDAVQFTSATSLRQHLSERGILT